MKPIVYDDTTSSSPIYLKKTKDRALKTWMCLICGWIYDEATGDVAHGLAPGTVWADVPINWLCPECGARKEDFEMIEI
jgi:rubredoxin